MKRELLPVLLLAFVNTLNFSVLIPVLPFIVKEFGGNEFMYGILLSVYPLFQFFATPFLGSWSDFKGRRPILLLSQAGTTLSWVIFTFAFFMPNIMVGNVPLPFVLILLARIADGATGGNNSVANAYLSDITTREEKTKAFGIYGAMVGIGLIVGPIIGGLTMRPPVGFAGPALTSLSISIVTLITMFALLPESLTKEKRTKTFKFDIKQELQFLPRIKKFTNIRRVKYLFFLRAMFLYGFTSFTSIFALYLIDKFTFNSQQIGLFFVVVGIFLIFNQMIVTPILARKYGDFKTMVLGMVSMASSQLLYMIPSSIFAFLPILYVNNFGFSVTMPTFKSLFSQSVDESRQGEIMGVDESLVAASAAVAPLIATWIYTQIGGYTFPLHALIILGAVGFFLFKRGWKS